MASLRNIMNIDDDHVNFHSLKKPKESAPRSHHRPESSASGLTFAGSVDHPATAATTTTCSAATTTSTASGVAARRGHGQSPSSRPPHTWRLESTPPLPHGYAAVAFAHNRPRSSTGTDLMDSPYGQGRGHARAPYSGPPVRPFVPGAEPPVKLTPVTGKVSRAKKGLAVHTCDICRPPKVWPDPVDSHGGAISEQLHV